MAPARALDLAALFEVIWSCEKVNVNSLHKLTNAFERCVS